MSLFADFSKENYDRETIEIEGGFVTYNIFNDNSVYVHLLYVSPERRKDHVGTKLIDMVIKKEDPSIIYTYVDLNSLNPELSLVAILSSGKAKIESTTENKIIIRNVLKEVK